MLSHEAQAIVARGPVSSGQWKLEGVVPRPIKNDEVLVRIAASGICLADVHFGDVPEAEANGNPMIWYPRVLGHEGSGWVEQVGRDIKSVAVGDPVVLSYCSCGVCYSCKDGHPAYCIHILDYFHGEEGVYAASGSNDFDLGGSFFGQSSLASLAIVKERCIVNLRNYDVNEDELQVFAPLGCGVQTGSAAFINIAEVQPDHDVAVVGVGGVGQSAVIAAAMRGCKTIIAVDRDESRLRLAKDLGATHAINSSDSSMDLVAEIRKITDGIGVHAALNTTGLQPLARQCWEFVRNRGKILQVGQTSVDAKWDVSIFDHMNSGKQILGCVQGDAIPQEYIPKMISWFREGRLPVDKIVARYPVKDYQRALEDMRSGQTIKPVLVWPNPE